MDYFFLKAAMPPFKKPLDRVSYEKSSTGRFFYFPDLWVGKKISPFANGDSRLCLDESKRTLMFAFKFSRRKLD